MITLHAAARRVVARLRLVVAVTAGAALSLPLAAAAEAPVAPGLVLVIEAPVGVEPERLRAAIARELGTAVTLAEASDGEHAALVLRAGEKRRAAVTYRAEAGRELERAVDLPADPERAVEILALLTGNLVRDEAAELAAALRGARGEEREVASPSPPPPPPHPEVTPPRPSPPPRPTPPSRTQSAARPTPSAAPCAAPGATRTLVGGDLVPYVGSSTALGADVVRRLSVNIVAGFTAGLDGAEVAGGVNIESAFACGVQLAGVANIVAGPVRGFQGSTGVNLSGALAGAQATAGVNVAGDVRGAQIASLNVAAGDTRGAQVGVLNVSSGDVEGVQIGIVNVAKRSSFSLGLLNVLWRGRLHVDVWGAESGLVMMGVKHGGDYFHNIYGAGVRLGGPSVRGSFALGIGGHFPLSDTHFVDVDLLGHSLLDATEALPPATLITSRAVLGMVIVPRLAIYAGPSANLLLTTDAEASSLSPLGGYSLHEGERGVALRSLWPGLTVGVQAL